MSKPTQGQWHVRGNSQLYAGDKMIALAAIKDVPDMSERMTNLELMAAAPDMLEALQIVAGNIERAPVKYSKEEKRKIVLAAIAKAKKSDLQTKQ